MDFFRKIFGGDNDNDSDSSEKRSSSAITSGSLAVELIATLTHEGISGSNVAFSPNSQYMITHVLASSTTIWETNTGKQVRALNGWGFGRFGFDNDHIVMTAKQGVVGVGNINTGEIILEVQETVEQTGKDNEHRSIIAEAYYCSHQNRLFIIWNPSLARQQERLFVAPELSYLQIRDGVSGEVIHQIDELARKDNMAKKSPYYLSDDSQVVALIKNEGETIPIIDTATGDTVIELPISPKSLLLGREKKLTFSSDHQYIGFQKGSNYHIHSVQTGEEVSTIYERATNKSKLLALSAPNSIYIYDTEALQKKLVDALTGDTVTELSNSLGAKTSIALSADGKYVATVDQQTLIVRNIETADQVTYQNPSFKDNALQFSPNGDYLVVHPLLRTTERLLFRVTSSN